MFLGEFVRPEFVLSLRGVGSGLWDVESERDRVALDREVPERRVVVAAVATTIATIAAVATTIATVATGRPASPVSPATPATPVLFSNCRRLTELPLVGMFHTVSVPIIIVSVG
ncbi:hypothetical protein C9J85_15790 [Haloferax sp. wsp5]|nr:hypothetical protein C9J85_15790 [Haloferax sp. wsp5]